MIWSESIRYGTQCRFLGGRVRKKIEQKKIHPCVFLVVFPQTPHAVLEIIPSLCLLQPDYPTDDLEIIGMGIDREEAIGIAVEFVSESLKEGYQFDIRSYMEKES